MNFKPEFYTYLIGAMRDDPTSGVTLTFTEAQDVVRFDGDADFELKRLVMFARPEAGDVSTEQDRVLANFNFNLRDNATGRTLFNGFVSTAELFGDGRIPFVLPTSHFFEKGGSAQMLYNPVDPGPDFGNLLVWLGLVGSKHFEKG